MNEKLRKHIDLLFADAPQSKETMEVKEELLENLWEHYLDLTENGKNEEEAYAIVVSNIGDVKEMIENLKDGISLEGSVNNEYKDKENEKKGTSYSEKRWSIGNAIDDFINNISSAFELDCHVVSDKSYSSKNIHSVNLSFISESLKFFLHDEDQIRVVEYMSKNPLPSELATVTVGNGEIHIQNGSRLFFISRSKVDIYLPRNYRGNLDVRVTSSNIRIEEVLQLQNVAVRGITCSVKGSGILAETISVQVGSGSIKLNQMAGHHKLKTETGTIHIDRIIGGGECKTTSGSVNAAYEKVTESIDISSVTGNIRLYIPKEENFSYQLTAVSGSIHTSFNSSQYSSSRNKVQGTIGTEPGYAILAKVVSGSIWMQNN